VLLFELLAGTLPYKAKRNTTGAMEEAILAGDAPFASSRVGDKRLARELKGDLDAILTKAIKRDPVERYQTAEALAADIQRYLEGHAIEARPDSAWYRLRKAVVRHRVPVMAASAVLVVALVGVTTTFLQGRRTAEESERTRLATAFVSELFRVNSNELVAMNAGAPRPTQAVLLERGTQLIEARFEKQPAMKAELYGVVGRVYADLGQDRLAHEFASRQLKSLRAQNASATQIASCLMLMSEAALAARRDKDAEDFAQQAVNTLSMDDLILPDALALLARAQILTGKIDEATQTVTAAKAALRADTLPRSSAQAWLLYVEGFLLVSQDRFDDALPLFESAIVEALKAEGSTSSAAVEMQLALATRLINRSRSEEGRRLGDAAIATLESQGGIHLIRAARARVGLQMRYFNMGVAGFPETIALLEKASDFLKLQSAAVPAEVLAEVDFERGDAYLGYGEYSLAKPLIELSTPILRASSQNLSYQMWFSSSNGRLSMGLGDHDEADRSLRERMEFRIKMGEGDSPFAAGDWWWIARNMSMQGRHAEAADFLSKAPSFGNATGDKDADYASLVPEALARVRLTAGNIRGAEHVFPASSVAAANNYPHKANALVIEKKTLYGELKCAMDQPSIGLPHLLSAEDALSRSASPHSPELARLRAVAGSCALALGRRKQAEEFAAQAKLAFTAQPRVSPYFKEPLKRLEQQLGLKSI
jgi:tetratricopeptide (TPR) repeat protein